MSWISQHFRQPVDFHSGSASAISMRRHRCDLAECNRTVEISETRRGENASQIELHRHYSAGTENSARGDNGAMQRQREPNAKTFGTSRMETLKYFMHYSLHSQKLFECFIFGSGSVWFEGAECIYILPVAAFRRRHRCRRGRYTARSPHAAQIISMHF